MKAKRLVVLTLLAILLVSTFACGDGGGQTTPTPNYYEGELRFTVAPSAIHPEEMKLEAGQSVAVTVHVMGAHRIKVRVEDPYGENAYPQVFSWQGVEGRRYFQVHRARSEPGYYTFYFWNESSVAREVVLEYHVFWE